MGVHPPGFRLAVDFWRNNSLTPDCLVCIFLSDPLSVRILYSSLPFPPLDLRLNGELLYIHACIHIHEISACLH